jgi:hypothetical protein
VITLSGTVSLVSQHALQELRDGRPNQVKTGPLAVQRTLIHVLVLKVLLNMMILPLNNTDWTSIAAYPLLREIRRFSFS